MKRDIKWILIISLIMFFYTTFFGIDIYMWGLPYSFGPWDYLRNINVFFFLITIGLATLYTTQFWKAEFIFKATIVTFIISMSLLAASSLAAILVRWLEVGGWV